MKIQLYSVEHAPRVLPTWQLMLDDLGCPPAKRVARVLGISERSVYRWAANGVAPRLPSLALFWLTNWGRAAVHVQASNDAIVACGYVAGLRREVARLEANVEHLSRLTTGAANSALLDGPRG
ncbi:MAG TPA: hypothetical protein VGM74_20290 [Burkholderiaceae bacterium]|jgi:hypothetical protein